MVDIRGHNAFCIGGFFFECLISSEGLFSERSCCAMPYFTVSLDYAVYCAVEGVQDTSFVDRGVHNSRED